LHPDNALGIKLFTVDGQTIYEKNVVSQITNIVLSSAVISQKVVIVQIIMKDRTVSRKIIVN